MTPLEAFFSHLNAYRDRISCFCNDQSYSYNFLSERTQFYVNFFDEKIKPGDVVQLVSEYNVETIAIFLALILKKAIIAPITQPISKIVQEHKELVKAGYKISIDQNEIIECEEIKGDHESHPTLDYLRREDHPGLIIMSSGSTGKPKAIVHDFLRLLPKATPSKIPLVILPVFLFDHIGGLNSIFNNLAVGNTLVFPKHRTPEFVAAAIERYQVNVLISSPSFLNLMFIKEVFGRYDLSNLARINYSGEVMPPFLLDRLHKILPHAKLRQVYGLSELGVIKTRSESVVSSRIKLGDEAVQYRVRDNMLEVKTPASMLGYLNAPNPFTEDGWFRTGDLVEVNGDYISILGRSSELINIGSEKVFPIEVENILLKMPEVADALVCGEPHAILGNIVVARIFLKDKLSLSEFVKRMHAFCRDHLPTFKIPQKIILIDKIEYGNCLKKMRHHPIQEG